MAMRLLHIFTLLSFIFFSGTLLAQKRQFNELLIKTPNEPTVFCVPNNSQNITGLEDAKVKIKYSSKNWIFITTTPSWISEAKKENRISDFYYEYAPPVALADTARAHHHVDEVHLGLAPLNTSYTGKGVIVGIVDQGLDHQHEDFKDVNGKTRVLRYWDHTMPVGPTTPALYGYGQVWDSTAINAGLCTSTENSTAHGTSVAGIAVGDGSANGSNKGIAPEADIIIVESNFNPNNWTLAIADAVDYIFRVADSLGKPAVVNLSVGTYMGSHDGNDPASEIIETLLDEKPGRIVVCAAGNSGASGKYHQHSDVTADTNFVWFVDNPSGTYGPNTIFFDVWSDQADALYQFAIGADTPSNPYSFRGRTAFHDAMTNLGLSIFDTIWNGTNRIAVVEFYSEAINSNYNLQVFVTMDSLNYNYRFETTGAGMYDLWSGAWQGYNQMLQTIPTAVEMPKIVDYILSDNDQVIVSSWNCSEKAISVGNFRNRLGHIDRNYNAYINLATPPGEISPNSSRGPNRHNITKPDVVAAGDVSLGAGPLWVLTNPAYYSVVDSGGMHVRNGGTSMASPVVSGIAALYLERCRFATYNQFKTNLIGTAYTDSYTGIVPNNTYGHGKPHAFDLLNGTTIPSQPIISYVNESTITSSPATYYQWIENNILLNEFNQTFAPNAPYGDYQVVVGNTEGCTAISNPYTISASIEENKLKINAYPNPSTTHFTIQPSIFIQNVIAYDMNGKSYKLVRSGNNTFLVDQLASGTYLLVIQTSEGWMQTKFVKP